jgi:hypothetical protein
MRPDAYSDYSKSHRAYFMLIPDKPDTGIESIQDSNKRDDVVYDLTGRRIERITTPGIYIRNGKKVYVR